MTEERPALGSGFHQYREGIVNTVTLVLTEQCNLRCSYCYMVHKNDHHPMPREVAYRAIDFILDMPNPKPGVTLEMTGGEPTLEMDLMADIARYFRNRLSAMPGHPWSDAFVFSVGTNGTTYRTPAFQRFLWENRGHAYAALTIDGIKAKHDLHRVFADGSGSYDTVVESVKLWLRQFPGAITKVTFGSEDLKYLRDSILHLWELGFTTIPANVVFEPVWKPEDPAVFEEQMKSLVDVALEKGLWRTRDTSLFWVPNTREVLDGPEQDRNWCGTGKMISIDSKGEIYPCVRFQDYSLSTPGRRGRSIGNVYTGFDRDALRAFYCLRKSLQSPPMCLECEMDDLCSWCSGWNYDSADTETIFSRATHICEMHKAQWRANQYYWRRLEALHGVKPRPGVRRNPFCAS